MKSFWAALVFSGAVFQITSALAQQVVIISDADEAEAAGFSQPLENRAHPKPTAGVDFQDSGGGAKSLEVTLTDTNYSSPGVCSDNVTPSCGGMGGIAVKRSNSIDQIAGLGTFTFEFYDSAQLTQYPVSVKVACTVSSGSTLAAFNNLNRLGNNQWRSMSIDLGTARFSRNGVNRTLAEWGESPENLAQLCPSGRDKIFELFISVGDRKYNPPADEAHYFDRFRIGDASPIYDFDLPEDEEIPEAVVPVTSVAVPFLPPIGIGALVALIMWRARRSLR
jgi:hypothetical protein